MQRMLIAVLGLLGGTTADADERPNIVLIMADDLGFSDLGCYGGEIATPNLDRIAAQGVRFRQFYNCARCCPTRAALLTGQYPHRVGLARNGRNLSKRGVTIAELLREAGYNTAMTGKWHLSATQPLPDRQHHLDWLDHQADFDRPFAPLDTYPVRRGFDRHYGIIWGVVNYFDPFSLVDGTTPIQELPDNYYITDAINQKSVDYIHALADDDPPFFLYVAHCAPHWPLHAPAETIAKYQQTYQDGWQALRKRRYQRQRDLGLIRNAAYPLPRLDGPDQDWDQLSEAERSLQAAKMAVHAAMVERMDQGIGDIVRAIKKTGRWDNTVLMFLSDNGASPEVPRQPGFDRSSRTRQGGPIHYDNFDKPGGETTYTGIGPRWASASNTPFRYWKMQSYDGGCHTPLIVSWPKGLKHPAGSMLDEVGHVIDLLPTCLDLAQATYPKEFQGERVHPVDGKSLLPTLRAEPRQGHARLYFEHAGGRAVREGDWKLVALSRQPDQWHLYHLAKDRTETQDVAADHPMRVDAMQKRWQAWYAEVTAK